MRRAGGEGGQKGRRQGDRNGAREREREREAKCERERGEERLWLGGKWVQLGDGGRGKVRRRDAGEMKR